MENIYAPSQGEEASSESKLDNEQCAGDNYNDNITDDMFINEKRSGKKLRAESESNKVDSEEVESKEHEYAFYNAEFETKERPHRDAAAPTNYSQQSEARSRSRSPSRSRSSSRSPSKSRRFSRSRSRSRRRRSRSRSRSRSPYSRPIVKDFRRGRRPYGRFPRGGFRGGRPFKMGYPGYQHGHQFGYRRREYSRSRSRSPKQRYSKSPDHLDNRDRYAMEGRGLDRSDSTTVKNPSDLKMMHKSSNQSFLAMLEEKQNKSKMIPIDSTRPFKNKEEDDNKTHGFINTFATVGGDGDHRKHTLSYDLECEGWQVIDDANESDGYARDKRRMESKRSNARSGLLKDLSYNEESSSSDDKRKKKKKSKRSKKKKKRRLSSESSESESEDEVSNDSKKQTKKKKKSTKKKRKSSDSSSDEEKEDKHRKKSKRKKSESSSSAENLEADSAVPKEQKKELESDKQTDEHKSKEVEELKKKEKKRKKKRRKSTSSESDSDEEDKKKKKKKSKKKRSRKRKHETSSTTESSDSSDSSVERKRKRKKRKAKKSKKLKKTKKDKKEKHKSGDSKDKKKVKDDEGESEEFITVYSFGDPPLELKWPKKLIHFTKILPSLQYSINPKVPINLDDFKFKEENYRATLDELSQKKKRLSPYKEQYYDSSYSNVNEYDGGRLASEYERFLDELNPGNSFENPEPTRQKAVHDSEVTIKKEKDGLTPSEIRAMEKMKKQHHKYDAEQGSYKYECDSAPVSTYYSAKKHAKSPEKEVRTEPSLSKIDKFIKSEDISISFTERQKTENYNLEFDKKVDVESKKKGITGKELLEHVKQKKGDKRDDTARESKSDKRSHYIGKIKRPPKKSFLKNSSITTANADSTQNMNFMCEPMKLDMSFDYNWYYQYYLNHYNFEDLASASTAAAYYAHYAMLTSLDYKQEDLDNWMQQQGFISHNLEGAQYYYFKDNNEEQKGINVQEDGQPLTEEKPICEEKPALSEFSVESTEAGKENQEIKQEENKVEYIESEEKLVKLEEDDKSAIKDGDVSSRKSSVDVPTTNMSELSDNSNFTINIEVLESDMFTVNSNILEKQVQESGSNDDNMSPGSKLKNKVKVRVTTTVLPAAEGSSDQPSPPPPPPPPQRPKMTTLTSSHPVTLPDGKVLPAGTKQIVVHPYPSTAAYRFTAEIFNNAYNSFNNSTANLNSEGSN